MAGLPPLLPEDIDSFEETLRNLVSHSGAKAALLIDQGGPLITQIGDVAGLDTVTLGALAAGAFAATQGVARILGETDFSSVYQQGRVFSAIVNRIDDNLLLIVLFNASLGAGMIKYYAANSTGDLLLQAAKAATRSPGRKLDLVSLDLKDASQIFHRNEGKK